MKKLIAILVAFMIVISIISCNKKEPTMDTENPGMGIENSDSNTTSFNTDTESNGGITSNTESDRAPDKLRTYSYNEQEYLDFVENSRPIYFSDIKHLGSFCAFEYTSQSDIFKYPPQHFYDFVEDPEWSYSYILKNGTYQWRFAVKEHEMSCPCYLCENIKEDFMRLYSPTLISHGYDEKQFLPESENTDLRFREDISELNYGYDEYVCILPPSMDDVAERMFEIACYYDAEGNLTKLSWFGSRSQHMYLCEFSIIFEEPAVGKPLYESLIEFLDSSTVGYATWNFSFGVTQ